MEPTQTPSSQPPYPPQEPQPQSTPSQPYEQPPANPVQPDVPTPQPLNPQPNQDKLHPMVVLQPGERVVCHLKRHPIGILSLYFSGAVAVAIIIILAFVLLPTLFEQYDLADMKSLIYGGLGLAVVAMVAVLAIATSIYWENQWVVTTDSITQISQHSLFGRQVSQLSMDNLEDVTVDQNGILPNMFNFGTLKVESAGERSKFQFPYCPNPNEYAREILKVHEQFLEERRNVQSRP